MAAFERTRDSVGNEMLHKKRHGPAIGDRRHLDLTQDAPLAISGWLYKMKRNQKLFLPDWNSRFFTIQESYLVWYHGQGSAIAKSGCIPLSEITKVSKIKDADDPKKPSSNFFVKSKKRSLFLRADQASDCDKWVRVIQMQIDLLTGGTSSGPASTKNYRKSNGGGNKYDKMMSNIDVMMKDLEEIEAITNTPTPKKKQNAWGGRLDMDDKSYLEPRCRAASGTPPSPMPRSINGNIRSGNASGTGKDRVNTYANGNSYISRIFEGRGDDSSGEGLSSSYTDKSSSGGEKMGYMYDEGERERQAKIRYNDSSDFESDRCGDGDAREDWKKSPRDGASSKLSINDAMDALRAKNIKRFQEQPQQLLLKKPQGQQQHQHRQQHEHQEDLSKQKRQTSPDMKKMTMTSPPKLVTSPIKLKKPLEMYGHDDDMNDMNSRGGQLMDKDGDYGFESITKTIVGGRNGNIRNMIDDHDVDHHRDHRIDDPLGEDDNSEVMIDKDEGEGKEANEEGEGRVYAAHASDGIDCTDDTSDQIILEEFDDEIENLAHGNVHETLGSRNVKKRGNRVSLVRSSTESGDWSVRS